MQNRVCHSSTLAAVFLTTLLASSGIVKAQVDTGRILGRVTDASGAIVPDVKIVITNTETGRTIQTLSNMDGRYESVPLGIGRYRVSAERAGFKRLVRDGIVLQIQKSAEVDLVLEVGGINQEVS